MQDSVEIPSSDCAHTCAICLRKSFYVCPRCGINYCSLDCYRAPCHNQCSESFYRDCCVESMHNSFASGTVRTSVADILAREASAWRDDSCIRITTDDADEVDASDTDVQQINSDLSSRFYDLALESDRTDERDLWSHLTLKEQRDFRRLLNSSHISHYVPVWVPWWSESKKVQIQECCSSDSGANYGPPAVKLRSLLPSGRLPHPSVGFVLADVLLGLIFLSRYYNGDYNDLSLEAAENLCNIVASFGQLVNRKSTPHRKKNRTIVLTPVNFKSGPAYSNISEVAASVQNRLCERKLPCSQHMMIGFLEDLRAILSCEQHVNRALCELRLFIDTVSALSLEHCEEKVKRPLQNVYRKLVFLQSCFNSDDSSTTQWRNSIYLGLRKQVSDELCIRLTNSDCEGVKTQQQRPIAGPNWQNMIRDISYHTQQSCVPPRLPIELCTGTNK